MLLHFIKLVPNDKNAYFPSSRGNPGQAMATMRNVAQYWEWPSHGPEHCTETLHLVTLQDTSPAHQETEGQVTKGQTSQLHLPPSFILPHFFSSRTYMLWKLKFHLQVSQSASVPVKCIPYLITTAITVPATKVLNNQAESGPAQSHL